MLPSFYSRASPAEDLQNCFDDNCENVVGEEDCYRLKSCTLCVYSKSTSVRLENPFCSSREKCYGGVQGIWTHLMYRRRQGMSAYPGGVNKNNSIGKRGSGPGGAGGAL